MHPEIELAVRNAKQDIERYDKKLHDVIKEYMHGYEFRYECGGGYKPTEAELTVIEDVIEGLLAEPLFTEYLTQLESNRRLVRGLSDA